MRRGNSVGYRVSPPILAVLWAAGVDACAPPTSIWEPSPCMVAKSYAALASGVVSVVALAYALAGAARFRAVIRCTLNDVLLLSLLCDLGNAMNVVVSSALMLDSGLKPFCDVSGYLTTSFGTGSMMFTFFFYLHAVLVLLRGEYAVQRLIRWYAAIGAVVITGGILAIAFLVHPCPERGTQMAASETPWCMLPHSTDPTERNDSQKMVIMRFFLMYVWWALNLGAGGMCFYLLYSRRKGFPSHEHATRVILYRGVFFVFVTFAWCTFFINRQLSVKHNHLSFVQAILHPLIGGVNALIFVLCERLPSRFRGEGSVEGLRDVVMAISDVFDGAPLDSGTDYYGYSSPGYSTMSLQGASSLAGNDGGATKQRRGMSALAQLVTKPMRGSSSAVENTSINN